LAEEEEEEEEEEETTVCRETCHSTWTHYRDSDPTSLCSFSLMLHA
jgi:hypothetical protein